jgi:PIN domain nuclease of toxin-antitoxin system
VLRRNSTTLEVSAISISEIAIKQTLGKLKLRADAVHAGLKDLNIRILPYTRDHAWELFSLATHHTDPFDRQIIAQAIAEDIPIVTPDEKFELYPGLKVIW